MLAARRFSVALSIGATLCLLAHGLACAQQAAIDPQSLLGECTGTWAYKGGTGGWFLTLTRLENAIYYGNVKSTGGQGNVFYDLTGALEGDTFKYTSINGAQHAELKVDGDKMAGTGGGRVVTGVEISCQMKK